MWLIRADDQHYDANTICENYPTMFTIELHHGGSFTKFPGITYNEGRVAYVDLVDVDELDSMMLELSYSGPQVIYYHFRLPNGDLDFCLRALGNDADVLNLASYITDNKIIQGLLPAIAKVYPCAEHRFCVRHIHENMRKIWKAREYKDHLWKCATTTTVPEFEASMREFSHFDREAFEWLKKIPPQHWARSHISGRAVTDMLLNNLCEVFNSKLMNGRDKPIISNLEFIRQYLMKRICNVMKVMAKAKGPLTPTTTKLLERNNTHAVQYTARWNGTSKFEVHGPWHDQHMVDMKELTCTCRRWELNGIPCKHVIATINEMADSGESVGELYTYVHKCYWLETWKHAYSYKVDPIKGRVMWPKSSCPLTVTPPPHHNQPGRPKIKRKRALDESQSQKPSQSQIQKLTRSFVSVTCNKCKNRGHNSRSCKGQGGNEGGSGARN